MVTRQMFPGKYGALRTLAGGESAAQTQPDHLNLAPPAVHDVLSAESEPAWTDFALLLADAAASDDAETATHAAGLDVDRGPEGWVAAAAAAVHAELAAWQMSGHCSSSVQLEFLHCLKSCQLGLTCDAGVPFPPLRGPQG